MRCSDWSSVVCSSDLLFNAQLITLPDRTGMALIIPTEAQDTPAVCNWLGSLAVHNGPIRQIIAVDVRQSMANGGGPASLRLRVVAGPADTDSTCQAPSGPPRGTTPKAQH